MTVWGVGTGGGCRKLGLCEEGVVRSTQNTQQCLEPGIYSAHGSYYYCRYYSRYAGKWWRTGKPGVLQSMGSQSQTSATKPHSHYKGNVERQQSSQQSHPRTPAASAASPTLCWQLSCFKWSRHITPFLPRGFPVPGVRGQWKPIRNAHMHHLLGAALSQWGMGADG